MAKSKNGGSRASRRRSPPTTEFRARGPRELGALAIVGVAAFLLMALATFDKADPTIFDEAAGPAVNWMGPAGHTIALMLRVLLGSVSYLVPLAMLVGAVMLVTGAGTDIRSPWRRLAALPFFLASSAGLIDRVLGENPLVGGGALGYLIGSEMVALFNPIGTYLLLGLVLFVSLLAMTRISLGKLGRAIQALWIGAWEDLGRLREALGTRWAERQEARAEARAEAEARRAEEAEREEAEADGTRSEPALLEGAHFEDDTDEDMGVEDTGVDDLHIEEGTAVEATVEEEVVEEAVIEEPARAATVAAEPAPDAAAVEISTEVPDEEATDWVDEAEDAEAAARKRKAEKQRKFAFLKDRPPFRLPQLALLETEGRKSREIDRDKLRANADLLVKRLAEYGVKATVKSVHPGPVITRYELEPGSGVKVNRIMSLADDLSLAMRAHSIRILAPVPGKAVVGIEIPNENREIVYLKDIIGSDPFRNEKLRLPLALGQDISGNPAVADLVKMPHMLIAGATGSGKSVAINTIICSVIYKATPDDVRLIMIDPKMLELNLYDGIPHMMLPVVTDMRKAALALRWAVEEMERRYKLLSAAAVRSIDGYNEKIAEEIGRIDATPGERERMAEEGEEIPEKLRYIVIIIDELADLMMVASKDVEESITRLAQMARAAGIHLIVATQRPSVDVITGIIKANFPARISFKVSSRHDSRTILDEIGAERLLGHGDMLMLAPGTSKIVRIHGALITETEVVKITKFLREQGAPVYDETILEAKVDESGDDMDDYDEKYDEALAYVSQLGHASISLIQRRFRIGYNRAARIVEKMEREGVLGPSDGSSKPRPVLVNAPPAP